MLGFSFFLFFWGSKMLHMFFASSLLITRLLTGIHCTYLQCC